MTDRQWTKALIESAREILWNSATKPTRIGSATLLKVNGLREPRTEMERLLLLGVVEDIRQKVLQPAETNSKTADLLRYTRLHSRDVGLTRAKVGRAHGRSDAWMARRFKQLTGMSFTQCLSDLRLADGTDLLMATTTRLGIKEIALTVGFKDPNSFPRLFKQRHGMAPEQWRRAQSTRDDSR